MKMWRPKTAINTVFDAFHNRTLFMAYTFMEFIQKAVSQLRISSLKQLQIRLEKELEYSGLFVFAYILTPRIGDRNLDCAKWNAEEEG